MKINWFIVKRRISIFAFVRELNWFSCWDAIYIRYEAHLEALHRHYNQKRIINIHVYRVSIANVRVFDQLELCISRRYIMVWCAVGNSSNTFNEQLRWRYHNYTPNGSIATEDRCIVRGFQLWLLIYHRVFMIIFYLCFSLWCLLGCWNCVLRFSFTHLDCVNTFPSDTISQLLSFQPSAHINNKIEVLCEEK